MITVKKNGTLVQSVDITSLGGQVWPGGHPGLGFWPVDGASIEKYRWKSYLAGSQ